MKSMEVLFVGTVVPEAQEFQNPAVSAAGQLFQKCLVESLGAVDGIGMSLATVPPIPAYPKGSRFLVAHRRRRIENARWWTFLPFINVTPVKQLCCGAGIVLAALSWRIGTRGARSRVIYQYNLTTPPGLFTWLAARMSGAHFCASINDIDSPGVTVPDSIWARLDLRAQRALIRRLDRAVVVSKAIVDDFLPSRLDYLVVEGGVDAKTFTEAIRAPGDARCNDEEFRFTFAGALEPINGVDVVLDAFRLLPDPRLRLSIAGRGSLVELVRERAAEDKRVEFNGMLAYSDVLSLYRRSDALLNVRITKKIDSRYFFPSKLMEYLASGVPVISTRTGMVDTVYSGFCTLIDDEDAHGVARVMTAMAATPKEQSLRAAKKGRDFVMCERTWERQAGRIARYLEPDL